MNEVKKSLRDANKIVGLVPVLPTPLNSDESVDEQGIAKLAQFVLRYPFSAVWALASAGEDQNLSHDAIDKAAKAMVAAFDHSIPVLVKTSSPGTRQTLEHTKRMADFGIDAAIIHLEHKKLNSSHAQRFFETIADASPVPILLYDNPGRGAELDIDMIIELSRHPNIVGIKAGGYDLRRLIPLCHFCDRGISVMTAGAGQIVAGLAIGAAAHTAIPLLAFPERAFKLYQYLEQGNLKGARAEQDCILKFLRLRPKLGNREVTGEVKCVLEIRGIIKRHVTAPWQEADQQQKERIARLIDRLDLFAEKDRTR